ncbi:MAG TPA: hypothetical protein VLB79_13190 [Solirubrobacterales bacterium]|nr:hypothetical protein [Solirubrobacterales bacterium]
MRSASFRWGVFAAIGLLVAVAVALLATQLVSEKIGISSEPVSAGESLAPRRAEHHPTPKRHRRAQDTQVQTTSTTPAAPTAGSTGSSAPESGDDKPRGTSAPAAPARSGNSRGSTETEPGDD